MQVSQEQTTNVGESRPQCSLAQSVEHAAVNRGVVGSSPTGGANNDGSLLSRKRKERKIAFLFRWLPCVSPS